MPVDEPRSAAAPVLHRDAAVRSRLASDTDCRTGLGAFADDDVDGPIVTVTRDLALFIDEIEPVEGDPGLLGGFGVVVTEVAIAAEPELDLLVDMPGEGHIDLSAAQQA